MQSPTRIRLALLLALVLASTWALLGCGKEEEEAVTGPTGDPLALIRQGWARFEAEDFGGAYDLFTDAILIGSGSTDPYLGAGWSGYLLDTLRWADAERLWNDGLGKTFGDRALIHCGLGLMAFDRGNYDLAIERMDSVLVLSPGFRFVHRPSVNIDDVYWILAESWYLEGDFVQSLSWVKRLNENFLMDSSELNGSDSLAARYALAEEIERLEALVRR